MSDRADQYSESIYSRAGGSAGLHNVVAIFYDSIFRDPILEPVFGHPVASHVDHLTAFLGEAFGGPKRYTSEFGGFARIIAVHRGLKITLAQRQRFIDLFMAALDKAGLGADRDLRSAIGSCIEFGTEIAMVNSNALSDSELHPQREIPDWHW